MPLVTRHPSLVTSFLILHSAFRIASADPVPVRFAADAAAPQTFQAAAYRGETLAVEARLTLRGAPLAVADGASATMHWQTNGMGDAWWTAPASVTTGGVVTATWSPSNDVGAASYRVFLRVAGPGGASYRANMLLRLLGSPGETPNALPLPVQVLDFARISYTNEPWSASSGLTTNDVRAIALTRDEAEAGFTEWVCDPATITATVWGTPMPGHPPGPGHDVTISFSVVRSKMDGLADYWEMHGSRFCHAIPTLYDPDGTATNFSAEMKLSSSGVGVSPSSITVTATRTRLRPTPEMEAAWDAKASAADIVAATNGLASAEEVAAASAETRRWTASTYGDTNSWIAIDGKTLGFYSKTNSASGPTTNTLWESSSALGGELAGVANRATNNTTRIAALEQRPDLTSWGDYAPDGSPNPDAEAVLYLNKALTLMGSGFSWATSGAYACLSQSGAVAFHAETNGEVRIGLDVVSNYFGMVQGGSVTVGCMTHGIRVEGSGDNTIVHLLYAYAGGEFPAIWGMTSLAGDKTELSPVWTDYGDGTAEAAVPGHPFYFFTATSSRSMEARFESKAPAAFPGGIYGDFASPPVKYNSVITIQQGGHTYRIPAELVQ